MIKLIDVLEIKADDLKDYKVHFAIGGTDKLKPYKKFLIDAFREWQEEQSNKNFSRKYVLSLIYYEKNTWLFGGVYEVLSQDPQPIKKENWDGWKYETRLVPVQTDLIGRAFVYYKKDFRASYPGLDLIPQSGSMAPRVAYIVSLLAKKTSINDFPGFDNVKIDYEMLESIVREEISTWKTALSNVMGIYLISDKLTGKQYVGSAYGDDCIWHRWSAYAAHGHGGNVELKELLSSNGENYKYNFKYSILEVCNMNLGSEYVIGRETHWKEVLQTRMFGLNKN